MLKVNDLANVKVRYANEDMLNVTNPYCDKYGRVDFLETDIGAILEFENEVACEKFRILRETSDNFYPLSIRIVYAHSDNRTYICEIV